MPQHIVTDTCACHIVQYKQQSTAHTPAQLSPVRPFCDHYRFANQIVLPACTLHARGTKLGSSSSEAPSGHAHSAHPSEGSPIIKGPWGCHGHGVGESIPGWSCPGSWRLEACKGSKGEPVYCRLPLQWRLSSCTCKCSQMTRCVLDGSGCLIKLSQADAGKLALCHRQQIQSRQLQ